LKRVSTFCFGLITTREGHKGRRLDQMVPKHTMTSSWILDTAGHSNCDSYERSSVPYHRSFSLLYKASPSTEEYDGVDLPLSFPLLSKSHNPFFARPYPPTCDDLAISTLPVHWGSGFGHEAWMLLSYVQGKDCAPGGAGEIRGRHAGRGHVRHPRHGHSVADCVGVN